MTERRSERPPRLVATCAYLGVIGLFQVAQVIIVLTGWYSASGEEQVKRFTDPLVADGMHQGDAETVYRVYLAILAILGASVLVFAVYTALGHAVSRIMLTITTPLMALVGLIQGSFLSILLSVVAMTCVFQLWNADVRRWFALISGKEQPEPVSPAGWPPPMPQPPAATPHDGPPHPPQPAQWQPPHAHAPAPPRPPQDWVKVLSLITLIVSSLVALGCGAYLLMYEFAREELVQEQLDSGMNWMNLTEAEIRDSFHDLAVVSWVVLPLCLVAISVSVVLLVRRRGRN